MRYHKDIGFPKSLALPDGKFRLIYTHHANEKSESIFGDGKVMRKLFDQIYVDRDSIIEVVTKDNKKCDLILTRYKRTAFDIILSIKPLTSYSALVVTVWNNNSSDHHETLDKSKYDLPNNYNSKEIDEIYAGQ